MLPHQVVVFFGFHNKFGHQIEHKFFIGSLGFSDTSVLADGFQPIDFLFHRNLFKFQDNNYINRK